MNREIYSKITALLERSGTLKPVTFHLEDSEMILGNPHGIYIQDNKIYVSILDEQKDRMVSVPIKQVRSIAD